MDSQEVGEVEVRPSVPVLGPCKGLVPLPSSLLKPARPLPAMPTKGRSADAVSWLGFWGTLSARKKDAEAG